jgi:hypothetical protein
MVQVVRSAPAGAIVTVSIMLADQQKYLYSLELLQRRDHKKTVSA